MASCSSGDSPDLVVVGAGPAGRALAHRAARSGLTVTLVDPNPHQRWSQTFGAFADELPEWLSPVCVAARSETVVVYTPRRRVLHRPYVVLDNTALRDSLSLHGVRIVTGCAAHIRPDEVVLDTGDVVPGRVVVDATGRAPGVAARALPRQRAYGVVGIVGAGAETVLMDWRRPSPDTPDPPTFSYRVPLGSGRFLVEETFLAGTPPPIAELARRWALRGTPHGWTGAATVDSVEVVDFALTSGAPRPWLDDGHPLRFGAAGGLMHQATGYSVAASLRCADIVVNAIVCGDDPRVALWPWRARMVYAMRERGLRVLTGLGCTDTEQFFAAFFSTGDAGQRAYLGSRHNLAGVLRAMAATFAATDWAGRRRILARAIGMEQIRRTRR